MSALFARLVKPPYVFLRRGLSDLVFERRRNLVTAQVVELEELGIDPHERVRYQPAGWLELRRALRRNEVDEGDVFVDFGSGMGRVLFQAAQYPFSRVVGVELSERLNEIARENIARNRRRLCCTDVEIVTADAVEWEVPDDVTVAYLFNPFTGSTFRAVIERLLASVDRRPRRLRIIYRNPREHDALMGTGRVVLTRRLRGMRPGREWSRSNAVYMYEVLPRPTGPS
jgi:SAM-dependent methyltransferase